MRLEVEEGEATMGIKIRCQKCGNPLKLKLEDDNYYRRGDKVIEVVPCEQCLDEAADKAVAAAIKEG